MNRRELAAAYLLDELEAEERTALERRLGDDAELRAELEAMRPLLARLAALPAEAWPQTAAGAADSEAASRQHAAATARTAGPERRWSVRPALALATLLVVAALGVGLGALLGGGSDPERSAPAIVLRPLQPTAGEAATVAMPRAGEMLFRAEGLPRLRGGEYYELWLMTDASRTVPVASFAVGADGSAIVRVPLPADPSGYRYFDVSRQEVSDGTAHSTVSVLRGPTS